MKRHVNKEDIQMANKYKKICPASLASNNALKPQWDTPARMAEIKTSNTPTCWQGYRNSGSLILCCWERKNDTDTLKSVAHSLKT